MQGCWSTQIVQHAIAHVLMLELCRRRKAQPRREIITVRGQSYVSRLPKDWPPTPLSARRVCPPPPTKAGGTHSPGREEGVGGQYFGRRETKDCPLSVIISLQVPLSRRSNLAGRYLLRKTVNHKRTLLVFFCILYNTKILAIILGNLSPILKFENVCAPNS